MAGGFSSYKPPAGSMSVPHPRTPQDILLRTGAIHFFAALPYLHLLHLLAYRKLHHRPTKGPASSPPSPSPSSGGSSTLVLSPFLLTPLFLALPTLLPLQLLFMLLPIAIARPYRQRVAARLQSLPLELGLLGPPSESNSAASRRGGTAEGWWRASRRLGLHAAVALATMVPLVAVIEAYFQRLRMRYHEATYVGNLGLDHRNGWVAIAGLVAACTNLLLVGVLGGVLLFGNNGSWRARGMGASGLVPLVSLSAAATAAAERGTVSATERRSDNDDDDADSDAQDEPSRKLLLLGGYHLSDVDWSSVAEVVYAALIQQFLLAATNHPVPALLPFSQNQRLPWWCGGWWWWPLLATLAWYLRARRRARWAVLGLAAAAAFVAATLGTQLGWDLVELARAGSGKVERWNYRWLVKDWVSARNARG